MEKRSLFFALHPLCAECQRNGKVTAARELDHIIALCNGGADDESNLEGLCVPCHKRKTAKDMGYSERKEIGADGWPVERL